MMGQILLLDKIAQFGTNLQCKIKMKSKTEYKLVDWSRPTEKKNYPTEDK